MPNVCTILVAPPATSDIDYWLPKLGCFIDLLASTVVVATSHSPEKYHPCSLNLGTTL
jgi:hypothetical protein